MRIAIRKTANNAIYKRLAEVRLSERDRQQAAYALRDAEAIVAAAVWVKESFASLGAMLPKPGFKH
jgi:hypothetical protein